uniref:Cation Diffusion Facilitator (CDF) Family putative n=1 Tax=Albugo laibachii Nc14 TaxID=890382 RepID=F0WCA9_9STRA|nr:Cation Diffusion Facilitator (CDF) Family putative [Albugo laibachii Nc14]|eukprot:CCA18823.1 Cation Diffusion Facilitator (CDF) Family putative [Albugo laibachii Nc14]
MQKLRFVSRFRSFPKARALSVAVSKPEKEAVRITRVGMWVNLSMAVSKGALGAAIPSSALMADAAHSLSDLLSDFVTLWAVRIARCPPDIQHPYGYGKYEAVGSLTVGTLLLFCGAGVAIDSFQALWVEPSVSGSIAGLQRETQLALAASMAGVSITAKELLYRATVRVLIANAWHHRTDALSSIVALGGIVGSICGAPFLDPAAGILVAAMIAKTGISVSMDSVRELTDKTVEDDVLNLVRDLVRVSSRSSHSLQSRDVEDVLHVSHVRARRMGPYTLVDLRVYLHARASVSMAQQVTARLRAHITRQLPSISELSVHIDVMNLPKTQPDAWMPSYREIKRDVRHALEPVPLLVGITHLSTHWAPTKENAFGTFVDVTIVVRDDLSVREARRVAKEAQRAVEAIAYVVEADIHLELGDDPIEILAKNTERN